MSSSRASFALRNACVCVRVRGGRKQVCLPVPSTAVLDEAVGSLPFTLTPDQQRVLREVLEDMDQPLAMFR